MPKEMTAMPKKQVRHKWKDNTCVNCGVARKKRERETIAYTYSALGKDGCFHDVPVWNINLHYAYSFDNSVWSFERPDCNQKFTQ